MKTFKAAANASSISIFVSHFEIVFILIAVTVMAFAENIRHCPGDSLCSNSGTLKVTSSRTQPQGSKFAGPMNYQRSSC